MTFGLNMAVRKRVNQVPQLEWVQVLGLQRTGSNSEDVHANKEGNLGSSIVDQCLGTTGDNKDMTDTTNDDTPKNHWVATESRVSKITDNKGKAVSQQAKRL